MFGVTLTLTLWSAFPPCAWSVLCAQTLGSRTKRRSHFPVVLQEMRFVDVFLHLFNLFTFFCPPACFGSGAYLASQIQADFRGLSGCTDIWCSRCPSSNWFGNLWEQVEEEVEVEEDQIEVEEQREEEVEVEEEAENLVRHSGKHGDFIFLILLIIAMTVQQIVATYRDSTFVVSRQQTRGDTGRRPTTTRSPVISCVKFPCSM